MQTDRNTGHRFEVLCIQQDSRHLERIDHVSGRESEREVLEHVLLVIVRYGIGEVDRIGCIGFQRIFQLDHRLLAGRTNNRQLHLGRSDNHILRRLLDLDQLVEQDLDLFTCIINLVRNRRTAYELGRHLIVRPSVRTTDIGA